MAGHNKWSKIKHRKAGTDAQKSKVFGKMVKLLITESKQCDGNVQSPGLKSAIKQAKAVNMSADNIQRAIDRGASADTQAMQGITYETFGPGGCAILIETLTDNKNRTAAEIRHLLSRHNSTINGAGSASWLFTKESDGSVTASTTVDLNDDDTEKLRLLVTELEDHDDVQQVYTNRTA
ncbi:MAG: YebC/PmpR family DNA-binding transcriptional regulator [Candidatus Kaiserbacteria bacterium]|nr:YebC/PmpR family DNA-binding transcriptional regulator [Candidatus Kaiserbacteria bacterium]